MNAKKKHLTTVLLVVGFLFVGLVMIEGCKKSEPAPETATTEIQGHEGHDHAEMAMATKPAEEIVVAVEQTTCPVMGAPIDKAHFAEYKGQEVYFCCAGCDKKFEADPEKYIAKLPQFNQPVEK
jgi:YHS domain-containing protein